MNKAFYPNSVNLNANSAFPFLVLEVKGDVSTPLNPGFGIMHWHHDLQIIYVRSGAIELVTLNGRQRMEAGNLAVINIDVVHRVMRDSDASYTSLIFPVSLLTKQVDGPVRHAFDRIAGNANLPTILLTRDSAWQDEAVRCILQLLSAYADAENAVDELAAYRIFVRLHEFWLLLIEHIKTQDAKSPTVASERMQAFLSFIAEHYAEPIALAEIARAGNVSESECLRCFRASLRTTPYRYLLDYRLERAARLLESGGGTVAGIAAATGFNQPSHFAKLFRERTGLSPRDYRKARRER